MFSVQYYISLTLPYRLIIFLFSFVQFLNPAHPLMYVCMYFRQQHFFCFQANFIKTSIQSETSYFSSTFLVMSRPKPSSSLNWNNLYALPSLSPEFVLHIQVVSLKCGPIISFLCLKYYNGFPSHSE